MSPAPHINRAIIASAAAAFTWTPASADGTKRLWLKGDDSSTITESGGAISQWTDKFNGYTFSQATGSKQPGLTTVNSRSCPSFDGGDELVMDAPANLTVFNTPYLWAVAFRIESFGNTYPGVMCDGDGVRQANVMFLTTDVPAYKRFSVGSNFNPDSTTSFCRIGWDITSFSAPQTIRAVLTYNGVNNNTSGYTGRFNGVAETTSDNSAYAAGTQVTRIGNRTTGATYHTGAICEVIIINSPSAADITNAETYLQRWG